MVFTYFFAGMFHFLRTDYYARLVPVFVAHPQFLVQFSGGIQILIAVLLVFPRIRRGACYGILLLWSVSLPINVLTVVNEGNGTTFSSWQLKALIPFHLLLMLWAFWHIRTSAAPPKMARGKKLQFLSRD